MPRRVPKTEPTTRFMQQQEFEDEAALMLAEYGREHGAVTAPPIPIDEIVEQHLQIAIELRDLRAEFPEGEVLGAIYFNDRKIAIDIRLVPEDFPSMRGRYRFTLAHELGHWRLHRQLYLRRASERTLIPESTPRPDHILRSHQSDPKEVQANRFAACLLMPSEMVKRAWHEWRGSMEPIYLDEFKTRSQQKRTDGFTKRTRLTAKGVTADNLLLDHASRPLAQAFQVSVDAMRIRLEGMKLLRRKKERTLFD